MTTQMINTPGSCDFRCWSPTRPVSAEPGQYRFTHFPLSAWLSVTPCRIARQIAAYIVLTRFVLSKLYHHIPPCSPRSRLLVAISCKCFPPVLHGTYLSLAILLASFPIFPLRPVNQNYLVTLLHRLSLYSPRPDARSPQRGGGATPRSVVIVLVGR